MTKNKLAFIPLMLGLTLLVNSWYNSYPLSITFPGDYIFSHISPLYWISIPLVLGSLYILGVFSKKQSSRFAAVLAIVVVIYSMTYFYSTMPTADSQYFRGLTEYFINTHKLDISQLNHDYFQWPAYFLFADIFTSISGLSVVDFEFFFYTTIIGLLTVSLYIYASKFLKEVAFLAVISFFISMYWFINIQSVPFSFALALTFVLFMLETQKKNTPTILAMLAILFVVSFTHFFVATFFILYLIFRALINRSKLYVALSLLTLVVYLITQIALGSWNFIIFNLNLLLNSSPEYVSIFQRTLRPIGVPFDIQAQNISRVVTITCALVCFLGFIFLTAKRRLRALDGAILLAGLFYSGLGFVFYSLGSRAIPIIFIPVSLGVAYFLKGRYRSVLKAILLVLLVFWVFVPIHNAYNSYDAQYVPIQTVELSNAEQFLLNNYNWSTTSLVLAHFPVRLYLSSNLDYSKDKVAFDDDVLSPHFPRMTEYDCILYSVGLGNTFLRYNYTMDDVVNKENLNVMYNNGLDEIAIKGSTFAQIP